MKKNRHLNIYGASKQYMDSLMHTAYSAGRANTGDHYDRTKGKGVPPSPRREYIITDVNSMLGAKYGKVTPRIKGDHYDRTKGKGVPPSPYRESQPRVWVEPATIGGRNKPSHGKTKPKH